MNGNTKKRSHRGRLAQETVEIVARGWYDAADGRRIEIGGHIAECLAATQLYTPDEHSTPRDHRSTGAIQTEFEVRNETTLTAARRIVLERGRTNTLCLNFASAKNPGGGFLGGSQAQEESLARSSALHASLLTQNTYYESNRACGTALYTDHMILSPGVPVFRDDDGTLLDEPYRVSILTAPAVNAGAIKQNEPQQESQIRPTMERRISQVLTIAAQHEFEHLILGAWGCGVFRNDPGEIAELFANALLNDDRFRDHFASVTFSVLDHTAEECIATPFRTHFSQGTCWEVDQ